MDRRKDCALLHRPRPHCVIPGAWNSRMYWGIAYRATKLGNQEALPMSHAKRVSTRKRGGKTMPALGAAGFLALASGASAEAPVGTSTPNTGVSRQVFLGEEEISEVSLATFYVFHTENVGSRKPGVQLARGGGGCGGCGGGGCRGCGGCGGGCARGCGGGCRVGFGFGGCGGCGCAGCGLGWWGVYGIGCAVGIGVACCISWGGCRYC
jgi:hypothetical protein